MAGIGNSADERLFNFQRRGLRGFEIGKGILEQRLDAVGGYGAFAADGNGRGGCIVGADEVSGSGEITIGVNDGQRCAVAVNGVACVAGGREQFAGFGRVEMQMQLLVGADGQLDGVAAIHAHFLSGPEEQANADH